MRLFFAIELPQPPRDHLLRVMGAIRPLAPRASWTRPQNLHLTLRFLGEMPDAQVPSVCEAVPHLARPGALRLACTELVFLPSAGRARVISAGLSGEMEALFRFQGEIEAACRQIGCAAEARPYAAHITLGRLRQRLPDGALDQLDRLAAGMFPGPEFLISQVTLMQSIQDGPGVVYSAVAHWAL